jgi:hypothetical protein
VTLPGNYHFSLEIGGTEYYFVHPDPRLYSWADISAWTNRSTEGALSLANLAHQAAIEQRSWHGGMGQTEMKELSAYQIADRVDTRMPGQAHLMRRITEVERAATDGGSFFAAVATFDGTPKVIVAQGTSVSAYDGGATDDDITGAFSGTATSVFHNGIYPFIGRENDSVVRLTGTVAAPVYTEISASSTNHPRDVSSWAIHDGYVWTNQTTSGTCNLIHYASQDDLADLEGNTSANADHPHYDAGGDALAIEVGPVGRSVKKLVSWDRNLYAFRTDGVWIINRIERETDPDGYFATKIFDYSGDIDNRNFNCVEVWNGAMWWNVRDRIYRFTGAGQVELSPRPFSMFFPPDVDSVPFAMAADRDNLYCLFARADDQSVMALYAFNGSTWHCLVRDISGNTTQAHLLNFAISDDYADTRLLWVTDPQDISPTLVMYLFDTSDYPESFEASGEMTTSRIDGGFLNVDKKWDYLNLLVNIPAEAEIRVKAYSFNDADVTEYNLGTITESYGASTVTIDSVVYWNRTLVQLKFPREAYGKELSVHFEFFSNTAQTASPVLYGMMLAYVLRPPTVYGYKIQMILADHMPTTTGDKDPYSVQDKLALLESARDSKTPLRFEDFLGHAAYVYPSSIRGEITEIKPNAAGVINTYELTVTMSLIEIEKDTCQEVTLTDGTVISGVYAIPCELTIEGVVTFTT